MGKLILTVPEGTFDTEEGKVWLVRLQKDMESLSRGEQKFMLLPSDDGWSTKVDINDDEDSWEINCGGNTYSQD